MQAGDNLRKKVDNPITFSKSYAKAMHFPYHDPLMIKDMIGNHNVHYCVGDKKKA